MTKHLLPLLALALLLCSGCATVPYHYSHNIEGPDTLDLRPGEPQFERGRPVAVVDGLGHYLFSLPSKLILWNWSVDNHDISPQTEQAISAYLAANDLPNVKVRVNEYAPGGEWRRLVKNHAINGFWRYTVGAITTTFYTILPGRLFGGDNYNPFTNTINLYSDNPGIAVHEAGHAKDFAGRDFKGLYATARLLPLFPLYQEAVATGDAIGYDKAEERPEKEKDAYKILYPAYGTYVVGEGLNIASWFTPISYPVQLAIQLAASIPGHIAGRIKAAQVEEPSPAAAAAASVSAKTSTVAAAVLERMQPD